MPTHNFESLINPYQGPASTFNDGSTGNALSTFDTLTDNIGYIANHNIGHIANHNTIPDFNTSTFANPAGPVYNTIAGTSHTSIVPSVQPPVPAPVPIAGAATPARHACTHPTCSSTFKRPSDLHRHAKVHQPGARKYECFVPGCPYRGARGFLRRDKLLSHQRNAHGLRY